VIVVGGIAILVLSPGLLKSLGSLLGRAAGIVDEATGIVDWGWHHVPVVWVFENGGKIEKATTDTGAFIKDKACYLLPFC